MDGKDEDGDEGRRKGKDNVSSPNAPRSRPTLAPARPPLFTVWQVVTKRYDLP